MILYKVAIGFLLLGVGISSHSQQLYTFKKTLEASRANNLFLKTASFDIPAAQTDIITARQSLNPSFGINYINISSKKYAATDKPLIHPLNSQTVIQLAKPFQIAGQRNYKIELAEKNVLVAEKVFTETQRNVLFDAGNKWLDVWLGKVNLDLIIAAKNNIDTLVQTNEIRLRNQVISTSEFTRTELLSDQYLLHLRSAQQDYENQLQNLRQLIGITDSISIDITDPLISITFIDEIDSLIRLSYQQRADIQAAQENIEASKSNIKLQRALSAPVPQLGILWNPQNKVPYVGIFGVIDLPFFNRNQGEIKKSKILLQQSEHSLLAVQMQVQTEVQTSYKTYQLNRDIVEKQKQMLQKSEQVLQSVRYAYVRGGTTIIDFLDAQRTWFDTQKAYYEAEYNYRQSYLLLLYVTGLINQL